MNPVIGVMSAAPAATGAAGLVSQALAWGLSVVEAIQTIASPALTAVIKALTMLGSEYFYMAAIILVYWCIDERQGFRLGLMTMFSGWANSFFKALFKQPRPFNLDPKVGLGTETNYGFPSGHAQNALVFFGVGRGLLQKKLSRVQTWAIIIGWSLILSFTRVYLGVHFPTDIFGGWLIAVVLLVLYFFLEPPVTKLISNFQPITLVLIAALITAAMNATGCPSDIAGMFFGLAAGYVFMYSHLKWHARPDGKQASLKTCVLRLLLGGIVAGLLFLILTLIAPGEHSIFQNIVWFREGSAFERLGKFVMYGILGLYVSYGGPWLFVRAKL
jgi:membrane-associated phospholipid phosphatase